ncbi:AAA domain-containing protein [Formicincola oecophyllae]|uniref:AAA domain-containing protein n=1 Tax=Formicincola oecophyllae TaxID=2558361 RepID=A0A4Y6U9X5_9PROT|nr:AAA family ATPase [Formicincola oecophyllae]QDH12955.1 AAA domain-containing protein [Formicincola oecophyllae]
MTHSLPPHSFADTESLFGVSVPFAVPSFTSGLATSHTGEQDGQTLEAAMGSAPVPVADQDYCFDPDTTRAVLAGFARNRRVLVQGLHGTGKSSHVTQIAARLNWPCLRLNLDSHISRADLLGRDALALEGGKQVTTFREGLLPWAMQRPVALILDEYDAGRPDVMFVLQRVLEAEGALTLAENGRVIHPHPGFRLFATANTVGLGNSNGLYHGVQTLNQAQLDRWHIVTRLDYMAPEAELAILRQRFGSAPKNVLENLPAMVALANLVRGTFRDGALSTVTSLRTLITWGENAALFNDVATAFRLSFLNRCDEMERPLVAELYQRVFGSSPESSQSVP